MEAQMCVSRGGVWPYQDLVALFSGVCVRQTGGMRGFLGGFCEALGCFWALD